MNFITAVFRSRAPETDTAVEPRQPVACGGKRRPAARFGFIFLSAIFISIVALNLLWSLAARASSWTLPEDTGSLKLNTSRQSTADNKGLAAFDPKSESFGFKPYIEYGLTDRLTMGLNNETRLVKSGLDGETAGRTDGFVTTELFLRGKLRDQDWYMLSMQDLVRLPGQTTEPGVSDSNLRLQYGRSGKLSIGNWTSSVKTGFQPRLDHALERFQADVALGWRPTDRWQLTAQSLNTVGDDDDQGSMGKLSISRNLTSSLSFQLGGWQTLKGGAGEPHGYDAMVWLRY